MGGLLLIVFVNFIGIGALIPVLPYAVIDEAGGSETIMALLMASFAFAMFVGAPMLGALSDRLGRKNVLVVSTFISACGHIGFALTTDLTVMFVARVVAGLAAGNIGVIQAIITDSTSPEDRAKWMGKLGAFIGLGFVAGPALGGLLSGYGGAVHTAPFLLAAALGMLGFVLALIKVKETAVINSASQQPFAERWAGFRSSGLVGFAAAGFFLNLGFAQVEASYVLVVKDVLNFTSRDTGWIFTWIGILIVIVQGGLIGPSVKRLTDLGTALMGSAFLVLGQFVTMLIVITSFTFFGPTVISIMISSSLVCLGFAFSNPTLTSAASKRARQGQIGGSLGMVQGFGSLGQVSGLMLAGPLYQYGGGSFTFGMGGIISMVLVGCVFSLWMTRDGKAN